MNVHAYDELESERELGEPPHATFDRRAEFRLLDSFPYSYNSLRNMYSNWTRRTRVERKAA